MKSEHFQNEFCLTEQTVDVAFSAKKNKKNHIECIQMQ